MREILNHAYQLAKRGALTSKQLSAEQKHQHLKMRLIISVELGHYREQITASYLGR